jgi:hypothetical protein
MKKILLSLIVLILLATISFIILTKYIYNPKGTISINTINNDKSTVINMIRMQETKYMEEFLNYYAFIDQNSKNYSLNKLSKGIGIFPKTSQSIGQLIIFLGIGKDDPIFLNPTKDIEQIKKGDYILPLTFLFDNMNGVRRGWNSVYLLSKDNDVKVQWNLYENRSLPYKLTYSNGISKELNIDGLSSIELTGFPIKDVMLWLSFYKYWEKEQKDMKNEIVNLVNILKNKNILYNICLKPNDANRLTELLEQLNQNKADLTVDLGDYKTKLTFKQSFYNKDEFELLSILGLSN